MSVAVIIPTYQGRHRIGNLLSALSLQDFKDFTVFVVIDGSTDNTEEFVQQEDWGISDIRFISQVNGGRASARNAGARAAKGIDLLIFLDDDMRPQPDCVSEHVQHHQKYEETVLVGAQLGDPSRMRTDFQKYWAYLSNKWMLDIAVDDNLKQKGEPFITAANFSIRQKLFMDLGGFDSSLTDAEDYDLAYKCRNRGVDLYFNKKLMAWHDNFFSAVHYIKRLREYQKAHSLLKARKLSFGEQDGSLQRTSSLKSIVYWFFSHPWWVRAIDHHNYLKVLPRSIRYKIYDIVCTALSIQYPGRAL